MKKIYFLFLFVFTFASNASFADCTTGYACSLSDLQTKNLELEKNFINELNDYFSLDINEDFMLGNNTENVSYKDFFPFSFYLKMQMDE